MTDLTVGLLVLWVISALLPVFASKTYRVIIFFGVFSLLSALIYLFLGSPDVAMAEAGISAFTTVFFIVCVEKYYSSSKNKGVKEKGKKRTFLRYIPAFFFVFVCLGLTLYFAPSGNAFAELRDMYLLNFMTDIGGQNAVTSIYLGYRVYDTLFEALLLVMAVVAVIHLSWYEKTWVADGRHSQIEGSPMAIFTMRVICPIILLFGAYLVINGHLSAGGGFLGGLAFASFLICRFLVLGIYDLSVEKAIRVEEYVFIAIIIVFIAFFLIMTLFSSEWPPLFQNIYLIIMNGLIGMKVAFGFFVLFYRYIAIERLPDKEGE